MIRQLTPLVLPLAFALAQEKELEPLVVESHVSPLPLKANTFNRFQLHSSPVVHLDRLLQKNPSFGIYRRSGSAISHPTSQGVSLRGSGTSATSRSLILLDGVPINDPFGGWIRWNRFATNELENISLGQSTLLNSSAKSIRLKSRQSGKKVIRELSLATGDVHGFSTNGFVSTSTNKNAWDATASFRMEDHAGHPVVRSSQRGLVDEDAWSRMRAARASISHQMPFGQITARAGGFDERRGNGTPLGRNEGKGLDWSLRLHGAANKLILFGQERDFSSVFPKVVANRASESVALDQYSVPGTSLGVMNEHSWEDGDHAYNLAISAIRRKGHTHEENKFTNKFRRAGGRQTQVGASFANTWDSAENWSVATKLQADWFRDDQGMRSGWAATDEYFPARKKLSTGGSLELGNELTERLYARAAISSRARQPTLNELYRPYRVGNFSVDANERLAIERINGVELGITWQMNDQFFTSVVVFQDHLKNSVTNVSSPTDSNDAQRINLDRALAEGLEIVFDYQLGDNLNIACSGLLLDTEVRRCPENSGLEGNRFAQTPKHRAITSLLWTPAPWIVQLDARLESKRYDDARNSRLLDSLASMDIALSRMLSESTRLSLSVHNLTDEEIQTGLSSNGIVSIGAPRNFTMALEWHF